MNQLYQRYKEKAAFFIVYIQEAHSSDVWQMAVNEKQGVVFAEPKTGPEREALANSCVRNLKIDLPALVDTMDNATERAYTGWPDRLYVVDKYGRVAYKSAPGPFGFRPKEMADALVRVTAE